MPRKKFKPFKARKARQATAQTDCLDSLPAPNHMHHPSLYDLGDSLLSNHDTHDVPVFPLMKLAKPETPGMAAAGTLAFIDQRYGVKDWADYTVCLDICKQCAREGSLVFIQRPPSWMDPEVFVRMLDKNPRTRALVRMYVKKGSTGRRIKMNEHIQQLFEEEYLVYMLNQFSEVRDLLAQWVIAHYAEDERNASKKRRKKPVGSA